MPIGRLIKLVRLPLACTKASATPYPTGVRRLTNCSPRPYTPYLIIIPHLKSASTTG